MSVSLAVDDREPPGIASALRAHPDVESVDVRRLTSGDVVAEGVGVERKSVGDYLSSALGRGGTDLESQVRTLVEAYDHAYVLLEADLAGLEAHRPNVAAASIRGSIASITARFGVPVVPCGDRDRLVDLAVRLVHKHTEEPSVRWPAPGAVPNRDEPIAKRMYACIEGIGPTTAEALHDAYPTVESLLDATTGDLRSVAGVGPVRAAAVFEAFRSEE